MIRFLILLPLLLIFSLDARAEDAVQNTTWESYGGVPGGGRYSALTQVNRKTVSQLKVAWTHESGDVITAANAPTGQTSYEVTPLHINDLLYYCTPLNRIIALNPSTGEEVWSFNPHEHYEIGKAFPANCRGLAVWSGKETESICNIRVFKGDVFGRLFAIDGHTGLPCEDFGTGGYVDLNTLDNDGHPAPALMSPSAILNNLVIVGGSVIDNVSAQSADGIVRAFDVHNGKQIWAFNPIPKNLSAATGAANVWSAMTVDEERGLIFLPTSSPSPDFYGGARTEPIPYANAVVALDGKTGEVVWHFQIVHHDIYDFDIPAQPTLTEVIRNGEVVPAVVQITKMGFTYVLHRDTGEPLFPVEEHPIPQSDIPGEKTSPTQPRPVLPAPFAAQELSIDSMWGLTFWDRRKCREAFKNARYDGLFTPASLEGSVMYPSALGGGNWGGIAIEPRSFTLIVKSQNIATRVQLIPKSEPDKVFPANENMNNFLDQPMNGSPYSMNGEQPFLSPWGIPCTPPPWGTLTSIDLNSGKTNWQVPLGTISFGPGGLLKTPDAWGSPNVGGMIVTGSGLIFIAGTMDSRIRAFDIVTGEVLWTESLPAPGMATPMTYESDGKQFLVVAAGGKRLAGTKLDDTIVAFALE